MRHAKDAADNQKKRRTDGGLLWRIDPFGKLNKTGSERKKSFGK